MCANTSILAMVMMFTIGDNRPAVAQAVHAIGSYRRTEDCRRKEQGENFQHGAQSVHGRLDIENAQRAQAVVCPFPFGAVRHGK